MLRQTLEKFAFKMLLFLFYFLHNKYEVCTTAVFLFNGIYTDMIKQNI